MAKIIVNWNLGTTNSRVVSVMQGGGIPGCNSQIRKADATTPSWSSVDHEIEASEGFVEDQLPRAPRPDQFSGK